MRPPISPRELLWAVIASIFPKTIVSLINRAAHSRYMTHISGHAAGGAAVSIVGSCGTLHSLSTICLSRSTLAASYTAPQSMSLLKFYDYGRSRLCEVKKNSRKADSGPRPGEGWWKQPGLTFGWCCVFGLIITKKVKMSSSNS